MMFSTNPFSQLSSNIHVFPSFDCFLDQEKDDLYITNHPNPSNNNPNSFPSGNCFLTWGNSSTTITEKDLVEGLGLEQCDDYYNLFWSEVKSKTASKKDHHSKIQTARGPRDRRVRLPAEVAKRFFYLQELLGFDKGSKTLDWLFKKSKISIDELIKRKKESSLSSTVTDLSEAVFMEIGSDERTKGRKKKCGEIKRKRVERKYKSGSRVNQSRAEARARARERTGKKLNVKKLNNESKSWDSVDCCSSNLTFQSSFWNSSETQNDKIGESVMEDDISMLYNYQHNLAMSNDATSRFTCLPKFTDVHEQLDDSAAIKIH